MKKLIYFNFLQFVGIWIAITSSFQVIGQIQVIDTLINPGCNESCNGFIEVEVTNAIQPITYLWSTGDTTASLDNLCVGTYELTVHDGSYTPIFCPWTYINTGVNASCIFYQSSILINNQSITPGDVLGVFYESAGDLYCGGYSVINEPGLNSIAIWGDDITTPLKDGFSVGDTINYMLWRTGIGDIVELTPTGYTIGNPLPWVYGNNSMYMLDGLTGNAIGINYNSPVHLEFELIPQNNISITSNISAYGQYEISSPDGNDGFIQLNVSGGFPPYHFLWSSGDTLPNLSNLTAGVYELSFTDSIGCGIEQTFNLADPSAIQVSAILSNYNGYNTSYGSSDGYIYLTITGGIPPYSIQWSTGFTGANLTNVTAGDYEVTISDQYANQSIESFSLSEQVILPLALVSSGISTYPNGYNLSAYAASDGSIAPIFTNGLPPYQYQWSTGATTQQISNLSAGLYSLTCSDQAETSLIKHFEIIAPPYIPIYSVECQKSEYNQVNISVPGGNDGYIILGVFGGNRPLSYTWSTGDSTMIINHLSAGTYTVTVTDGISSMSNSFMLFDSIQIPPISSSYDAQNLSCNNACNGEINVSIVGGNPPYYITWNDGSSDTAKTNLCAGTYSVCLTDSAHAIKAMPWTYIENIFASQLIFIPDSTILINGNLPNPGDKIGVFNFHNGIYYCAGYSTFYGSSSTVNANSAFSTSSYDGFHTSDSIIWKLWRISDGAEVWLTPTYQNNYNGLFSANSIALIESLTGTYNPATITPTPNSINLSFTLTEPDPIQTYAGVTQEDTLLNIPGSIFTYSTGGTLPYTYQWSNGDTTAIIDQLTAGTYTLTLKDANLCDTSYSWTVTTVPIPPLTMSNASTNISCFGACDGTISISISSGNPPYQFTWSEGSTTQSLSGLCPGTYELTVSDLAYSQTHSFVLTEPAAIQMDTILGLVDPLIGNNGSIDLNISGGTLPYTFEWSTGGLGEDVVGIGVGTYTVTFTDGNNCQEIYQFTMTNAYNLPPVNIQSSLGQPLCYNDCAGSIQLSVSGGLPPYSYVWAGGETVESLTNLCAGLYEVTVSTQDTSISLQFELINPQALDVILTSLDIEPSTGAPGSISLNINGGTLPYLFAWSSAETSQNLSISQPGTYTVTISDANGCTISSLASVDIAGFPWGLIQNQQHHKIVIPPTASIVFDGNTPAGYDAFGVFYSVNGVETCGGYLIYNSNTDTLLAYGNNPSTSAIDGFQPNEDFVWKIWDASSDSIYEVAAYYNAAYPQTGQFAENGLSRIDSMQYNSLSGYVSSYSKSPLQSGKLLLIRAENDRYQTIIVKDIEDGYFRIAGIYPGNYLIYAIPNPKDEIGIPTYFINHLGWETANLISVAGHTGGINLTLKPSLPLVSGAGLIQGIVHNDSSELYNPVLFETDWFPDAKLAGNVARNVPVLLFNDQHEPAVFTLSDANGMFRFPDLNYGTYYVGAELAGLNSDSVEVVLDATRPTANVNFTIQDESVIGIPVPELITDLAVYPNPASHELFIQAQSPISQIRLNSLDGKSSEFEIAEQQADFLRIDISMLPAGIYVLELNTPSGTQYCKVLKME